MKLVKDARQSWRWWSVRFAALGVATQAAWEALQIVGLAHSTPSWVQSVVTAVIFFGVLTGRLIDQGGAND